VVLELILVLQLGTEWRGDEGGRYPYWFARPLETISEIANSFGFLFTLPHQKNIKYILREGKTSPTYTKILVPSYNHQSTHMIGLDNRIPNCSQAHNQQLQILSMIIVVFLPPPAKRSVLPTMVTASPHGGPQPLFGLALHHHRRLTISHSDM
jgi:hypothetical protein